MSSPVPVAWTTRLENARALDPLVRLVRPLSDALVADPARRDLLRGAWHGHALHPVLTDLPIGLWTSASVLDVVTVGIFYSSWRARRRGQHVRGAALSVVGTAALGVTGYLGGHLVSARKVSSRDPVFED